MMDWCLIWGTFFHLPPSVPKKGTEKTEVFCKDMSLFIYSVQYVLKCMPIILAKCSSLFTNVNILFMPQLQKAIEGSTRSGVRLRPPLASFRDASREAKEKTLPPSAPPAPCAPSAPKELESRSDGGKKEMKDESEPKLAESTETECKVSVDSNTRSSDSSAQGQPPSTSSPSIPLTSLRRLPQQETYGERESDDELI